jgi:hypothetical protein
MLLLQLALKYFSVAMNGTDLKMTSTKYRSASDETIGQLGLPSPFVVTILPLSVANEQHNKAVYQGAYSADITAHQQALC